MIEIKIVDVVELWGPYGKKPHYCVVVDRKPEYIYRRVGIQLIAEDSGFFQLRYIHGPVPGDAFGGAKFDMQLEGGEVLHCEGQVWDGTPWPHMMRGKEPVNLEPMISIGVATLDELRKCYVFMGGNLLVSKLEAWLKDNKPTYDYYKYDERSSLEYWEDFYAKNPTYGNRVCTKRARKLRQRGVTIRRAADGAKYWHASFERRKAEILEKQKPGWLPPYHPDRVAAEKAGVV